MTKSLHAGRVYVVALGSSPSPDDDEVTKTIRAELLPLLEHTVLVHGRAEAERLLRIAVNRAGLDPMHFAIVDERDRS